MPPQSVTAGFEGPYVLNKRITPSGGARFDPAFNFSALDVDHVSPETFVELLRVVELTQLDLANLGGVHPMTVNRWCSSVRTDRLSPPRHAVLLVVQFGLLSPVGRRIVRSILPDSTRQTQEAADAD